MSYLNFYGSNEPVPLNIPGTSLSSATNSSGGATLYMFATDHLIITKPRAAASDGLLTWDAYSPWPSDGATSPPPPVAGKTWHNAFYVYASNSGAEVLIYSGGGLDPNLYATADDAYNALNALMPMSFTGYTRYRVTCGVDPTPGDNRGGLSLLIQRG